MTLITESMKLAYIGYMLLELSLGFIEGIYIYICYNSYIVILLDFSVLLV